MISIDFKVDTKYGQYSDCLHLSDDHTFTDEEIEQIKQQRINNWISYIENAANEIPVVEDTIVDPHNWISYLENAANEIPVVEDTIVDPPVQE